jgi:hypothetical protein
MTMEISEGKAAARDLAARLPGWSVWYGQHTGRFWAMPRTGVPGGAQLAEADTTEELEDVVRRIMGSAPRPGAQQEPQRPDQMPMDTRREPVGSRN